ncbi:MAG: hypothetical protein MJ219_04805, partial [Mycoplasmoidaceae bacterium]|nr:hypothetical protein [Mycoplasmoidaceae bacterium]
FSIPLKYFFSVATPELIHISDGSLTGIKDLDGTSKCCLDFQKSNHVFLILFVVHLISILFNYLAYFATA